MKYLIKTAIALGLILWLFSSKRLQLEMLISEGTFFLHVIGIFLLTVVVLLQVVRWWMLLQMQRIDVSLTEACKLTWMSQFFSLVTPGMVGSEIVRGYYMLKNGTFSKSAALSTILIDRGLGLYAQVTLGLLSLGYMTLSGHVFSEITLSLGLFLMALFVVFHLMLRLMRSKVLIEKLKMIPRSVIEELGHIRDKYRFSGKKLPYSVILSFLSGGISIFTFYIAGTTIDDSIEWQQVFLVCPLVFIAVSLPITPAGIGVGETAAALLFSGFNIEGGATIMILYRLWNMVLKIPGGILFMVYKRNSG